MRQTICTPRNTDLLRYCDFMENPTAVDSILSWHHLQPALVAPALPEPLRCAL